MLEKSCNTTYKYMYRSPNQRQKVSLSIRKCRKLSHAQMLNFYHWFVTKEEYKTYPIKISFIGFFSFTQIWDKFTDKLSIRKQSRGVKTITTW